MIMLTPHASTVSIRQRPVSAEDETMLLELFAADKRAEFAAFGLPAEQAESLVVLQYRGRAFTYSQRYPEAEDSILLDVDGMPAGRLLVNRAQDCWRIVDIAVLPSHRGKGLATAAIRDCQARGAGCGASLELSVAPANPARMLYERLGFRATSATALAIEMEWKANDSGVAKGWM
jgi:ribosomal protein S18 acetylase RimI-like enzyme